MIRQRAIELLAPAKNLECGIEAVNHGADAVYIGAPRFGARAAAGNSLEDIAELVKYAHLYRVRIYVTVNTILRDEELKETEAMIWDLYRVGVDALIVQDMGTEYNQCGSSCNQQGSSLCTSQVFVIFCSVTHGEQCTASHA